VPAVFEKSAQMPPHHGMIVGKEDPDHGELPEA
jgi:hypothetical protein